MFITKNSNLGVKGLKHVREILLCKHQVFLCLKLFVLLNSKILWKIYLYLKLVLNTSIQQIDINLSFIKISFLKK